MRTFNIIIKNSRGFDPVTGHATVPAESGNDDPLWSARSRAALAVARTVGMSLDDFLDADFEAVEVFA